ncbi:MAG TPA: hypothetical protein VI078_13705 [bacterium]
MKTKLITTVVLAATLGLGGAARAATDCGSCEHEKAAVQVAQSGHESMAGHDMKKMEGNRHGTRIREAKVEGFTIEYYLIDMREMAKSQEHMGHETGMAKMKSHHLMTYVTGADAKPVTDAKVGYLIVGAGGAEQKAMAMAMDGGYGADVDLTAAGPDKVTVKIVAGAKTLLDEFTYPVPKQK